jgi:hypothetical protein
MSDMNALMAEQPEVSTPAVNPQGSAMVAPSHLQSIPLLQQLSGAPQGTFNVNSKMGDNGYAAGLARARQLKQRMGR